MSLLLLDTTFLIDAERGGDLDDVIGDDDDVAIAAVTVAELLVGPREIWCPVRVWPERSIFETIDQCATARLELWS